MNSTPRPTTPGESTPTHVVAGAPKRGRGRPPNATSEEEKKKITLENQRAWREIKLAEDPNYYKKYTKKCPIHICNGVVNQCLICFKKDVSSWITWNNLTNSDPNGQFTVFLFKLASNIVNIPNYNLHMISYYDEFYKSLPNL